MPKCSKCGKKFSTLQALNDHFRSVHPSEKFVAPKQASSARTLITIVVIVIIVMGSLVGFLIYNQIKNPTSSTTVTSCPNCNGQPVPQALYQNLTKISPTILNAVGAGSGVTKLSAITNGNGSMTNNGKPEVLYIGGEFCPFCAAERWAMVIALAQFGNFSGLELMQSSSTDSYPSTATFTFANASYTSQYISFVAVEHYTNVSNAFVYQPVTASEQSVWTQYDSSGSIPFLDINNQYTNGGSGSQNSPGYLHVGQNPNNYNAAPYNWTYIGTQLTNTSNLISKSVLGSANNLISTICSVITNSGQSPPSVCSQSFAKLPLAIMPGISEGSPILSVAPSSKLELPF
ncbi:MAG: DUF929 family protein [Nitrososphaerota archaeon]|nr:DUF929 family protein [Nitrososphaerota archaeon]